jgi:hypothetical protein
MRNSTIARKIQKAGALAQPADAIQMLTRELHQLREQVGEMSERLSTLEYFQQREEDRRGYEEQGPRYTGRHPSSCACDRCLRHWR